MDHRKILRRQIEISQGYAIAGAALIIVLPELLAVGAAYLFLFLPGRIQVSGLLIGLVILLLPLSLLAFIVYQRLVLTAALYATLLKIDENLEKLVNKQA